MPSHIHVLRENVLGTPDDDAKEISNITETLEPIFIDEKKCRMPEDQDFSG